MKILLKNGNLIDYKNNINEKYDILIEEIVEGEDGLAIGRAWFQAPDVDGSVVVRYEKDLPKENNLVKAGRFVKAKIVAASDVDLDGILTGDSELNSNVPENTMEFATEVRKD